MNKKRIKAFVVVFFLFLYIYIFIKKQNNVNVYIDTINKVLESEEGIFPFYDGEIMKQAMNKERYFYLRFFEDNEESYSRFKSDSISFEKDKRKYDLLIEHNFLTKTDTVKNFYTPFYREQIRYRVAQPVFKYHLTEKGRKAFFTSKLENGSRRGIKYANVKVLTVLNTSDIIINDKDTLVAVEYIVDINFYYNWAFKIGDMKSYYEFSKEFTSTDTLIRVNGEWRVSKKYLLEGTSPSYY